MAGKLPAFVFANPLESWPIPVQCYRDCRFSKFVIFLHLDQICIMITITIGSTKILISHIL